MSYAINLRIKEKRIVKNLLEVEPKIIKQMTKPKEYFQIIILQVVLKYIVQQNTLNKNNSLEYAKHTVNKTSYTKNGLGYSIVGFLGEIKNSEVVIYGHYHNQVDSIRVIIQ